MGNLIRAANLRGFTDLVKSLNGDPVRLLRRFHLADDIEQHDDAFIPFRQLALLLEASADSLDCPDFGMRLSRWQGLSILGPVAVITRNATDVLTALQDIGRYLHVHSPALSLSVLPPDDNDHLWFRYEIRDSNLSGIPQGYELSMANAAHILQLLGGEHTRPLIMQFTHEPVSSALRYREFFACTVRFGQPWCGFKLSLQQLRLTIDQADSETHRLAERYLSSFQAPGNQLTTRVEELIRALLSTGHCRIDTVARQLALHPRTLQRRLARESKTFEQLLDSERQALASRYLGESGLHLAQIAGLLGYNEQSSFNRACRRWFGKTPRAQQRMSLKDN